MSDARQKNQRGLGRGLDSIVRKEEASREDVSATDALLGKVKRAPVLPPTPPRPSTPSRVSTDSRPSIAPARDFTRTANSIVREAVPQGAFAGKAKQLYDFLYAQTRGAVVPRMSVTLSKIKLMAGADIGSEVTLKKNLDRLKAWGLIAERVVAGTHGGNEYTVHLPEEATPSRGSTPSRPSDPLSNLEPLEPLESSPSSPTLIVDSQRPSGEPQTSFKTKAEKLDDDEAAPLARALAQAERELTGKVTADAAKWEQLADLLVTELKIAAGRTNVSSVPAFLTEHLRRRLWKKEKRQVEEEGKAVDSRQSGAAKVDASKCPDCFGASMWYPEGFEKGVARCGHDKLRDGKENAGGDTA